MMIGGFKNSIIIVWIMNIVFSWSCITRYLCIDIINILTDKLLYSQSIRKIIITFYTDFGYIYILLVHN